MKVLVGYAPSPEGQAALETGTAEARLRDAELVVFQHHRVMNDAEAQRAYQATTKRGELEQRLAGLDVPARVEWSVGVGSPAGALLRLAEREQPDLIVIGIRQRTPVGKAFLGSNSQEILLNADCQVLAVKARGDERPVDSPGEQQHASGDHQQ